MEQLSVTTSDRTSTSSKSLSDMPLYVVALIIERSDYKEQLLLRKTSKSLRELVDNRKPSLEELSVDCDSDYIMCFYNDQSMLYTSPEFDDYEKIAFDDLTFTLKNPKLQLETFNFHCEDFNDYREFEKIHNVLKSINHQLSVKECKIDVTNLSTAMSILPYLKPGVLEKIKIYADGIHLALSEYSETINEIALLDQWKQAKKLKICCLFDDKVLKEHATHFKSFQFDEGYIEPETLLPIRDFLLNHKNFRFCLILGDYESMDEFRDISGMKVSPNSSHYSIPYSDDYLEFMFKDGHITIEKKKKQTLKRGINRLF
ncbi:unnamed protein product [Caenorhabditis brenneri]